MSIQSIGVRSVFVARTSRHALWIIAVGLITLYHGAALRDAGATTIDDFSQPNPGTEFIITTQTGLPPTTLDGNPVVYTNANTLSLDDHVSPTSVIGGERKTTFNVVGTVTATTLKGLLGQDLSTGGLAAMTVGSHGAASTTTVTSTYLQGGVSAPIDLTSGGTQTGIDFKVLSTDQLLGITVNLENTHTGNIWSYSATAPVNTLSNTPAIPENVVMPFSSFSGPLSPGAGTSVNLITIVYNGGSSPLPNIDFTIGAITTTNTPEPASAALFAIGFVAIGGMALRQARRRAAIRVNSQSL